MRECKYMHKGFDIMNVNKMNKKEHEYFNPYGYNIYSDNKQMSDSAENISKNNPNNKIR